MRRNEWQNAFKPVPDACYQALMAAAHSVQEEPIVKKKLSTAAVFAIIIVLAVGAALAAISLQSTGEQILETEQTDGYYESWTGEHKTALIESLVGLGYLDSTPQLQRLIAGEVTDAAEAERIADEALEAFTGMEVSEISFMTIMQAAWGPFADWSTEEQAWYSQLQVELGLQREGETLYVAPAGGVDEQAAVALARQAIADGYGVAESALASYTVETSFQVPEFAQPGDTQAYWAVSFTKPADLPAEDALFEVLTLFVNPDTGAFYEPVAETIAERQAHKAMQTARNNDALLMEMRAYEDTLPAAPGDWSVEQFAAWSDTFRDRVLAAYPEAPAYFGHFEATMFRYAYGLPDANAMTEEQALAAAEEAIVSAIGRKRDEVAFFTHDYTVLYDVTDPQAPLWKFFFRMPGVYDSDTDFANAVLAYYGENGERLPNIKIEINAYTGEIVNAFTLDAGDFNSTEDYRQMYLLMF